MDRIAEFLVKRRKVVLGLTALTTLLAILGITRVSINADVTEFMLDGNQRGRAFKALQAKYQSGDPIMVLLESKTDLRSREGLLQLVKVRDGLSAVAGVKSVGMLVPEVHPLTKQRFTAETLQTLPAMLLRQITHGPGANLMLSEDGKSTMAVVLADNPDAVGLASRLADHSFPEGISAILAGNPVILASVIADIRWFLVALPPCVILLLLLVFTATIGSRKLALASVIPAILGSIWTFGLIFGLGFRVDLVTIVVPIFVIVMGSADGLHFVTHLQEAARQSDDRVAQTASALRQVGIPMILTTISTAAGFLSLVATDVGPIRQLGLFVAIGITFAGIVSFFSLPAALSGLPIPQPSQRAIGKRLTAGLRWAAGRRAVAVTLALGLITFASLSVPKLGLNADQLFFFPAEHPVRASFAKMTQTFGGATPLFGELVVDPQRPLADQAESLTTVQEELAELPGVRRVFSVLDVAAALPSFMRQNVLEEGFETPMGRMVTKDGLRFVLFPGAFTSEQLKGWIDWADNHDQVRVLTGMPVLFDEMSRLVFAAQKQSLAMAFVLVFIMLLIAYRRLAATLVALLPLAITTAVLLGFLAVSGIQLHLLTAVITAIVIGVGIDYAIHLIAAIEHARIDGPGYVLRGIDKAGRPIVANALGVAIGMSALLLSPFAPHHHISLVMWVSMITAALTALIFIPALSARVGLEE